MRVRNRLAVCVGLGVLAVARHAGAHPLAPTLLDLRELGGGRVEVTWKASLLSAPGASVAPVLPPDCRAQGPPSASSDGDSLTRTWTVHCPSGLIGAHLGFSGLETAQIVGFVRIVLTDGRTVRGVVSADNPLLTVPLAADPGSSARTDAERGIVAAVTGVDALLFLAGLTMLVGWRWRLFEAIAALTVGQSLTLSLVGLGLLVVPSASIELVLAGCVFLLAAELARDPAAAPSWLRRWPWVFGLGFGILQGLSLGDAWQAADPSAGHVPLRLAAFNGGLVAGQLGLLGSLCLAALALRGLRVRWPRWAAQVPLYAMGSLAAFWCFERAAALLR